MAIIPKYIQAYCLLGISEEDVLIYRAAMPLAMTISCAPETGRAIFNREFIGVNEFIKKRDIFTGGDIYKITSKKMLLFDYSISNCMQITITGKINFKRNEKKIYQNQRLWDFQQLLFGYNNKSFVGVRL